MLKATEVMANPALRSFMKDISSRLKIHIEQIRHGHRLRGKPPNVALTLQQRLEREKNIFAFCIDLIPFNDILSYLFFSDEGTQSNESKYRFFGPEALVREKRSLDG